MLSAKLEFCGWCYVNMTGECLDRQTSHTVIDCQIIITCDVTFTHSCYTYFRVLCMYTSIKKKGYIGMANYEKQVEQEAAYPIPISLYNCYRTVRHERNYQMLGRGSYASLLSSHASLIRFTVLTHGSLLGPFVFERVCAATLVSEWSVCEVCLSKHSPVMFTQQQSKRCSRLDSRVDWAVESCCV